MLNGRQARPTPRFEPLFSPWENLSAPSANAPGQPWPDALPRVNIAGSEIRLARLRRRLAGKNKTPKCQSCDRVSIPSWLKRNGQWQLGSRCGTPTQAWPRQAITGFRGPHCSLVFSPLFRGDFVTFLIVLLVTIIVGAFTLGIGGLVFCIAWAFFYNRYYTRNLISKGYKIVAATANEQLATMTALGVAWLSTWRRWSARPPHRFVLPAACS